MTTLGRRYPDPMTPRREDLGSWLEGTPGSADDDLGLPASGSGSRASLARRVAAITVDWIGCLAISGAFFRDPESAAPGLLAGEPMATVAVFAVATAVLVGLLGHSVGHRLLGLRVLRLADLRRDVAPGDVRAPGILAAVVRTVLLCLVIPAVVWGSDGRGLHDIAAGTVILRR